MPASPGGKRDCHDGCPAGQRGGATESHNGQGTRPGDGTEPDARFTLANERTFLAWNRTALALVVAGLGIIQLLPPFPGVPWGRRVLGIPLIVLGAAVSMIAYREWLRVRYALRHGTPLPKSVLPVVLAATIAGIAMTSPSSNVTAASQSAPVALPMR